MSIDYTQTIEWNGKALSGWVIVNGAPTKVSVDRETIHAHAPGFNARSIMILPNTSAAV